MNETDRRKVRRRRSLRLSRQSSALHVPLVSDTETSDCPGEEFIENVGASSEISCLYKVDHDIDSPCGSFWEEVDETKFRKRKSRRSNIGFYVAKSEYDTDDNTNTHDTVDAESHLETEPEQNAPESPVIEIPRRPCPEASPYVQTPVSFLDGPCILDTTQSKTPSVAKDRSLPYIQTPSSASLTENNVLGSGKRFDDAFMLGVDTPENRQCVDMSCPPSCEDESEDSLLICTPDLAKFKKSIRFRCSLDFSEFNQTPTKDADNTQDSIHESPIVGYVYDKLNASDVVRKRRSTSHRIANSSSLEGPTPKSRGEPRRLLPVGSETETKVPLTKSKSDRKTSNIEPSKSSNVSVQSSSSSQSNSNTTSSTSGLYTSCVEDFLSASSAGTTPLDTPVEPQSPALIVSQLNKSEVEDINQSTPISGTPVKTDENVESKADTSDLGHSPVAVADLEKEHIDFKDIPKQSQNESPIPCNVITEKESSVDIEDPEPKTKERNIASDVCDMFRSLARRFSGGKKKKRRSGNLKKLKGQPGKVVNEGVSSLVGGSESPVEGVSEGNAIFSFRKEPQLLKQTTNETFKTLCDSTPKTGETVTSLDFSPFLPVVENESNVVNVDPQAESPVWKLQSDLADPDNLIPGTSLQSEANENSPLITETVLQEKSINLESDESQSKRTMKKQSRPKRRSIEASVLQQECREFQASEPLPVEEEEDNVSLRRSRRTRRSSLEILRHQSQTPQELEELSESQVSPDSDTESQARKPRGRKKAVPVVPEENLEELYRNKNYTLPTERMWETLFESPEKSKQPTVLQSRRKYRRTITFDTVPPAKIRKRLQRAVTLGWDITGKKRPCIPMEEVKNKIALLATEIDREINFN